jgi:hypothetical protein
MPTIKNLDLDFANPRDARKFFRGYHTENHSLVQFVVLENGARIAIDTATDDQVVAFASQIYHRLYLRGFGYFKNQELH